METFRQLLELLKWYSVLQQCLIFSSTHLYNIENENYCILSPDFEIAILLVCSIYLFLSSLQNMTDT